MTKERCECCDAPKGKPCPRWVTAEWGFFQRNITTGEMRPFVGCFYHVALQMLFEFARSMNSAASAVESTRNMVADGFSGVVHAIRMSALQDQDLLAGEVRRVNGPAEE